jgi:hypothetical protein
MLRGTGVAGTAAITGGTISNVTLTGLPLGAVGTPTISPTGDATSGIWWASATNMSIAVAGVERFRFGSGGRIGTTDGIQVGATVGTADTNLTRGSAGVWKFVDANSFSANGSVATTMTSLGPTGSHTTIQEWLTIQNASGVVRYIPCY